MSDKNIETFEDNDEIDQDLNFDSLPSFTSDSLQTHYDKHGIEMGYDSPMEYEKAAQQTYLEGVPSSFDYHGESRVAYVNPDDPEGPIVSTSFSENELTDIVAPDITHTFFQPTDIETGEPNTREYTDSLIDAGEPTVSELLEQVEVPVPEDQALFDQLSTEYSDEIGVDISDTSNDESFDAIALGTDEE